LQEAYWVECRAKPGTDSDGTVFIAGHTVAGGRAVFNDLPRVAVGDDIEVMTPSGTLVYRVNRSTRYDKHGEAQQSPEVRDRVAGRLVLVTCYLTPDGQPTNDNFLVQAQLRDAAPRARV
jgi:LPXTG-site transpeptidase (sortase) family protein